MRTTRRRASAASCIRQVWLRAASRIPVETPLEPVHARCGPKRLEMEVPLVGDDRGALPGRLHVVGRILAHQFLVGVVDLERHLLGRRGKVVVDQTRLRGGFFAVGSSTGTRVLGKASWSTRMAVAGWYKNGPLEREASTAWRSGVMLSRIQKARP